MTQLKPLLLNLALLGLNIVFVVGSFRLIPDKQVAATIAGLSFILTSAILVWRTKKTPSSGMQFAPWACGAFLVLVAIPMVAVRLMNWSVEFSDLSIWGIPGPLFHQWSSKAFLIQPLGLVLDAIRSWRRPIYQQHG